MKRMLIVVMLIGGPLFGDTGGAQTSTRYSYTEEMMFPGLPIQGPFERTSLIYIDDGYPFILYVY